MSGKFIVLEGLDGAGIRTQAVLLAKYLDSKGFKVFTTKEPTAGILGGLSKAALNGEWSLSDRALQLLFCADRAHHLDTEIEPRLEKGKIVISDRYIFSTLAYGFASKINYKWLRAINLSFRKPDLGIVVDIKPTTSMLRTSEAPQSLQLFDNLEKIQKVRQMYLHIAKEFHLKVVDGEDSIDNVSSRINAIVDKFLRN